MAIKMCPGDYFNKTVIERIVFGERRLPDAVAVELTLPDVPPPMCVRRPHLRSKQNKREGRVVMLTYKGKGPVFRAKPTRRLTYDVVDYKRNTEKRGKPYEEKLRRRFAVASAKFVGCQESRGLCDYTFFSKSKKQPTVTII